ncbi:MAG: CinA family protein [Chitinophagaceae bacterium]|nr:CinA family protein [Chitinophagaceae bacterium]
MSRKAVRECSKAIAHKGWSIAFVESATAGRMCAEFSLTPEAGDILKGGISCYNVFVKEHILQVPQELIEAYTPESEEVTEVLAVNAADFFETEIVVAVTGLTTAGGSETREKPIGTMFVHILMPGTSIAHREVFSGKQEEIVLNCIDKTAQLILNKLSKQY